MPKIPESYGIITQPSAKTDIAMPDSGLSQMTAKVGEQLSGNIMNMATQMQYQQIKEDEAFNAAQVIDFKTQLAKFENEKRLALNELPATNPATFQETKNKLLNDRQVFVSNFLDKNKDNKQLASLIKRTADVEDVDFTFDVDRVLSGKKKEYGVNKIYEGIYSINQRLENGGNAQKLSNELNTILTTGLQSGLIDQNDINREKEKQKAIIKQKQQEYQQNYLADQVASGKIMISSNDSDERKIGELAWQRQLQNTLKNNGNPDVAVENFISKTNYIPSQVKNVWSSQLTAGTPEQKIKAAQTISDLIDSNPRLQSQLNSDDIAYASSLKSRLDTGLSPKQIIEFTDSELAKIQPLDKQGKLKLFNDSAFTKKRDNEYKSLTNDLVDRGWFKADAEISGDIKASFDVLVKDAFTNNKATTPEGAIEYAKQQIKNTWKATSVGKPKVMKYAPETFFQGDTDWISKQLDSTIAQHVLVADVKNAGENYELVPIPNAIRNGKPSYFITDNQGTGLLLNAQNQPVVFTPDFTKTTDYKKMQDDLGHKLSKEEMKQILEGKQFNDKLEKAIVSGNKLRYATPYSFNK